MRIQRLIKEVKELEKLLDGNIFRHFVYFYGKYKYNGKIYEYATFWDDTSDVDTAVSLIKHTFKCVRGVRRRLIRSKLPCTVSISILARALLINCGNEPCNPRLHISVLPTVMLLGTNIIMIYPKKSIPGSDSEVIIIITPEHVGISVNGLWKIESCTNSVYHDFASWKLKELIEIAEKVKVDETKFFIYLNDDVIDLDGVSQ